MPEKECSEELGRKAPVEERQETLANKTTDNLSGLCNEFCLCRAIGLQPMLQMTCQPQWSGLSLTRFQTRLGAEVGA